MQPFDEDFRRDARADLKRVEHFRPWLDRYRAMVEASQTRWPDFLLDLPEMAEAYIRRTAWAEHEADELRRDVSDLEHEVVRLRDKVEELGGELDD